MNKRSVIIMVLVATMLFTLGQTAFAFKDIKNDPNEQKIESLKKRGILSGDSKDGRFNPQGKLTYAEGMSLIVKGLELNIDHIRFIKEPKASDYFANLKDNAWYSNAFIIAELNGLEISKNVKANDHMTKEQFGHHLFKAMLAKGDYAFIEIFMMIEDEADINSAYMDSIQKLLISKTVALDSSNKFYPKNAIIRSEAAGWLYNAIKFVEETKPIIDLPEKPNFDLKLTVTAVNDKVNKVTVSAQAPHPGYGIRVSSISFEGTQAVIHVETILPDPDKMYPQVITDVQTTTYVDSLYTPVLPESLSSSSSASSSASAK